MPHGAETITDSKQKIVLMLPPEFLTGLFFFATLFLFLFSICLQTDELLLIPVSETGRNLAAFFRNLSADTLNIPSFKSISTDGLPYYASTMNNLNSAFISIAAGGVLAIAGAVFQYVFRNPLAAPTILGVSNGIQLGLFVLVMQYGTAAILMEKERYLYTYLLGLGTVALALAAGKIAGKNRTSIADMLLVGMVVSQLIGVVMTYYELQMTMEQLDMLQNFTMGRLSTLSGRNLLVFLIALALGLLPLHLLRFRLHVLGLDDDLTATMGVRPNSLRVLSLLSASLLVVACTIHCGSIGVLSMLVPYLVRYVFRADFKHLYILCFLLGGFILLLSRNTATVLSAMWGYIPVNLFISLIAAPAFIGLMIRQRRDIR